MSAIEQGKAQAVAMSLSKLSKQQYEALEKQALSRISMRDDTQAVQAGYLAGVHDVLRIIRNDYTA